MRTMNPDLKQDRNEINCFMLYTRKITKKTSYYNPDITVQ